MSKLRYRERCMGWRIVVMKDPVCGNVWTNPHDSLSESFKNVFVVILTDCPAGTHFLWTIPTESKKHTSMHFNFDLDIRAFFGLGDPFERHSKLWRLVCGSYWKNQLSSPVITRSIKSGSASTCSSSSAKTLTRASSVNVSDFWAPSWHKFFSSPILQLVSDEQLPGSCSLHQQSCWLSIFDRIERVLVLVLCCHLSVLLMVFRCTAHLQQWFCLQKTFCASERLILLTLHHLQRPAEVFRVLWWHCHWV